MGGSSSLDYHVFNMKQNLDIAKGCTMLVLSSPKVKTNFYQKLDMLFWKARTQNHNSI